MEKNPDYTVQRGIETQSRNLQRWQTILKPSVYEALKKYATENNETATDGYDIRRGFELSNWVDNYKTPEPTAKTSAFLEWHNGRLSGIGSFQSALFTAFVKASSDNKERIADAFPKWFLGINEIRNI